MKLVEITLSLRLIAFWSTTLATEQYTRRRRRTAAAAPSPSFSTAASERTSVGSVDPFSHCPPFN